jgi:hypothetical protein
MAARQEGNCSTLDSMRRESIPLSLARKHVKVLLPFGGVVPPRSAGISMPKHLDAEIGFFSVLHTWNSSLVRSNRSGRLRR